MLQPRRLKIRDTVQTILVFGVNYGIWRYHLVKKILRRATSSCLPTKDLLRSRRVEVNIVCPVSNESPEYILHSLVTCPFSITCHSAASSLNITGYYTFKEWLQLLFTHGNQSKIQSHVMVCWMLWKNCNDLVWNQHSIDTLEVVHSAFSVLN